MADLPNVNVEQIEEFKRLASTDEDTSVFMLNLNRYRPEAGYPSGKLYKEYNANEIAADEKYKGKIIEVTGVIRDIGNDIMDNAYITLVGNEYFGDIQCYFNEKSVVASLSKGKRITVMGSCSGLMMNVHLNDCIIK